MSLLAPTLEAFFTERLLTQRQASQRTITAYRDALRLLVSFACQRCGKTPSCLEISDLDARLVSSFLGHLESDRHNTVSTRNARLAAIRSLFRFAALRHPEHAEVIQRVLDIPAKRYQQVEVAFLSQAEVEALLEAPDRTTWTGRRDHALLVLAIQAGLRVSELTGLTCGDLHVGGGPHVRCHGKGRKDRATPLTAQSVAVLRVWLRERSGAPSDPLFPSRRGGALSPDAVEWLLNKYWKAAASKWLSLGAKKLTPHVLRHTCAMNLLQAGVDTSVIALWLGHESVQTTQIYLHADMKLKEQALARTAPLGTEPGRYRPPDPLLAFLEAL